MGPDILKLLYALDSMFCYSINESLNEYMTFKFRKTIISHRGIGPVVNKNNHGSQKDYHLENDSSPEELLVVLRNC